MRNDFFHTHDSITILSWAGLVAAYAKKQNLFFCLKKMGLILKPGVKSSKTTIFGTILSIKSFGHEISDSW